MKIVYLVEWDAFRESGVARKVNAQAKAWADMGHMVRLIVVSPSLENGSPHVFDSDLAVVLAHSSGGVKAKIAKVWALRAAKGLIEKFHPDLIYYRQSSWTPGIVGLLKVAGSLIVEVNSDDAAEVSHYGVLRAGYHLLTRSWLIKAAAGFVCVSKEIGALYSGFGRPVAVIGNGFDLTAVKAREPSASLPIRAVFVGSDGQAWHGVDKIIDLAVVLPEIEFHIVGVKVRSVGIPSNVVLHGRMDWVELNALYQNMDFGFGTLALHRKNMKEACPLKSREYLAYGLPIVGAYVDTDLSGEDFFLEIANTESGVLEAKEEILKFAKRWKGKAIDRRRVQALIGNDAKEQKRLVFMKEVLRGK